MSRPRKIVVDGVSFRYIVGKSFTKIWDDDGVFCVRANHEVADVTPWTWEKGQWKRTTDGMLRPKQVAEFIRKNVGVSNGV